MPSPLGRAKVPAPPLPLTGPRGGFWSAVSAEPALLFLWRGGSAHGCCPLARGREDLSRFQEFSDRHINIVADFFQQDRGQVAALMDRNGSLSSIRMFELFVGAFLADFLKAEAQE